MRNYADRDANSDSRADTRWVTFCTGGFMLKNLMDKKSHYRVIILGSGAAGLTAAIYAARANLQPLVIEGSQPGGQLTITTDVENYPGFPKGIMGPDLMEEFKKQAVRFGTEVVFGEVTSVDLKKRSFQLAVGKETYTCDTFDRCDRRDGQTCWVSSRR